MCQIRLNFLGEFSWSCFRLMSLFVRVLECFHYDFLVCSPTIPRFVCHFFSKQKPLTDTKFNFSKLSIWFSVLMIFCCCKFWVFEASAGETEQNCVLGPIITQLFLMYRLNNLFKGNVCVWSSLFILVIQTYLVISFIVSLGNVVLLKNIY